MLSVIVTFYDETAFLRTALQSIRNQGLAAIDLIVVNDNPERFGPDDLRAHTRGFGARVIHHTENRGLSAARNTGIAAARGQWIGFLDADDYYTVGGLARHLDYARKTGADITHGGCFLGAESAVHSRLLPRDAALHMERRVVQGRMAAQEAQFIVSSWSNLYRADFLTDNDLWFDPEQRRFEDRLFVLNAVTAARKVAFLGEAVRVWRQRAGSISSSETTPETHLLQVQLLEKCMAHMRQAATAYDLPPRFEKRELFNTVSRLIWDMDILAPLAAGDPAYADMARRIPALLGDTRFGQDIFTDPMVAATSRVGMQTRRGLIRRVDFLALHKAWRSGDYAVAARIMATCAPTPASQPARAGHPQKRLVLHVGLHKTGTTFVQHHLMHHRDALRRAGVLVPETGFDLGVPGRPGALSGHQGLVRALRAGDSTLWDQLHAEIAASPARTVVLSAENLSFPTAQDRDALIADLFAQLGAFAQIDTVACIRAPHAYAEAFHAEWVATAHPGGARSLPEMLVDHGDALTDFAALFAPFEAHSGREVRLADFDAMRKHGQLWPAFCSLAGLPDNLAQLDLPRYPTPDRDSVQLLQLLNASIASQARRHKMIATYLTDPPKPSKRRSSLLPVADRLDLIDRFEGKSATFCAARGYAPDLGAMRQRLTQETWTPPQAIPLTHIHALLDATTQCAGEPDLPPQVGPRTQPKKTRKRHPYSFVIRPRPWLVFLLDRMLGNS